ncbi:hypothetical protein [Streptomyces lancefieldiae]|uniref:Uncharacterized protein n=1 Tax=Streptomyces lancefieldiae TaxID=3075520 RepID=A0ABU3AYF4_9ACTN|nr:hypothetical protein [Streptomyces sp. DSM 40712]MDT0615217.1 hypothetical protein [Streptomyces sp. DSM 40712]
MIPAIASRIPLVRRTKAPALPLEERINHLAGLTVASAGASHHDLVARACGVLNYAALIASDVGLPDLAEDLCWRQHQVFANAGRLSGRIAVMSLMPLVNLARLQTRAGHGELAYSLLHCLNDAARHRSKTDIDGRTVDLSTLTGTDEDHRTVCQELYITLLVDGARALAQIGRWTEAADAMAQHRGIGNRLLDGRQIKIMALMEQGLDQQARDLIDTTQPAEPWEKAVALLLQAHCRPADTPVPGADLDCTVEEAVQLLAHPDPPTAVFQTRTVLSALELDHAGRHHARILDSLISVARLDAYAAREALHHPVAASVLDDQETVALTAVIAAAGLGAGALSAHDHEALTGAASNAERELEELLQADSNPG